MMTKTPALNAEQEAGAQKDAGGSYAIYVARIKPGPPINYRPNPAPPLPGAPAPFTSEELANVAEFQARARETIVIYIEAERWVDARSFALRKLGVPEVLVVPHDQEGRPIPRWQIRFTGSAGGGNPLRMQARQLQNEPTSAEDGYRDVREL